MTRSFTHRALPRPQSAASADPRRIRWDEGPRLVCLLTTLHPERALSRALVQHLLEEMPDIDFRLAGRGTPQAVWVCGYSPGSTAPVVALRVRYPRATLVVTGRGPVERWESEAREAGADFVCTWPIPYARLSQLLHLRRVNPLR
ncbi:MAG: hypothetical protein AB1726_18145 [Planctomycetota bacterium]